MRNEFQEEVMSWRRYGEIEWKEGVGGRWYFWKLEVFFFFSFFFLRFKSEGMEGFFLRAIAMTQVGRPVFVLLGHDT